jgi:hypothetical protein
MLRVLLSRFTETGDVMKHMIMLIGIAIFLTNSSLQAYFFRTQWQKNQEQFELNFTWEQGVTIMYDYKQYPVSGGRIAYSFNQKVGALELFALNKDNKGGKEDIGFNSSLTEGEFKSFAARYDPKILNMGIVAQAGGFILDASTLKGFARAHYDLIKDLMSQKFPGLKITTQESSWFKWPKINWKHVLGAIGLGAAGYAYYKYYHAK